MTRDEAGRCDQVRCTNRVLPKAQVRHRPGARFVGVVDEVRLRMEPGGLSDNRSAVLVGADGAVRAEAIEHSLRYRGRYDAERGIDIEAGVTDIIDDAHREAVFGVGFFQLVEHGLCHGGREILRREPIATANHTRHGDPRPSRHGLGQGGHDIEIERFPGRSRFLGPVEDGNRPATARQRRKKVLRGERAIEPNLEDADLCAAPAQRLRRRAGGLRPRSHQDDHVLGIRRPVVIE